MFLIHRFSLLKLFRENSVTRLGDILKFRMKYFVSKVAQMYSDFWAILKNIPFQIKTALATFWAIFGKNWATFNFSIWSHRMKMIYQHRYKNSFNEATQFSSPNFYFHRSWSQLVAGDEQQFWPHQ